MTEKCFCLKHEGHKENIRELCEFKRDLTASGTGTIDRIWEGIDSKVSKGMMKTFCVVVITLVISLFGLVYNSNSKVLHEMVSIKVNVQMIMEKLK